MIDSRTDEQRDKTKEKGNKFSSESTKKKNNVHFRKSANASACPDMTGRPVRPKPRKENFLAAFKGKLATKIINKNSLPLPTPKNLKNSFA